MFWLHLNDHWCFFLIFVDFILKKVITFVWKKMRSRFDTFFQRCRNVLVPNCLGAELSFSTGAEMSWCRTVFFNGCPNCLFQWVPNCLGAELSFSTGAELSCFFGTGQFGTWMRQYSVLTTIVWYLLIVNIFVLVHVVL
jgi:hypothetical protein